MKREGIKPDATVYTHLLNACRQCGRLSACEAVFDQMKEHHPPLTTVVSYNVLMSAATECGAPGRAIELLDELLANGDPNATPARPSSDDDGPPPSSFSPRSMEPDRITYTTAMNAAGLALQPDRAFEIFRTLQAMGAALEERTWCLLIKACGEAMDYDRALSVFQEARSGSDGPEVTVLMYNGESRPATSLLLCWAFFLSVSLRITAMMNAAGKVFDMAEQQRLFKEMHDEQGIPPNAISYNILLHVLGELKQVDKVEACYAQMLEQHVTPDAVTFSVLIGAAGKALNLDLAFEYYEQLKQAAADAAANPDDDDTEHGNRVAVGTVTYINLINAW